MIKWDLKDYASVALIFLLFEVIVLVRDYLSFKSMLHLLWFCNYAPLLLAMAFFFKKKNFVKAIINVGLVAQVGFLFIFFYLLYTGNFNFRSLPEGASKTFFVISTIIIHLVIILALFITYREKPTRKSLYLSFLILIVMYASVLLFAPAENQINLITSSGNIFDIKIPYYTFLWPILAFILIVLPSYWLQHRLYEMHVKKTKKIVK